MKELLTALKTLIANNTTMQAYMGIGGPYIFTLPQPRPRYPYMVVTQIGGSPNWQGFTTTYVARPRVRITLWDRDQDVVQTNGEFVAKTLDALGSLSLGNGEICRTPIRIEEPLFLPQQEDRDGLLVFGCVLDYRFNVQRTRGV